MIVEELLQKGYWTASETILKVIKRLEKDHDKIVTVLSLREKFFLLVTAQYLVRLPHSLDEKPVPTLDVKESEQFAPPIIDFAKINLVQTGKAAVDSLPDQGVYWAVNFDRFHQDMRDKLIVNSFSKKFDENVGEFIRLLLQQMYIRTTPWAEISNPVPVIEIRDIVRKQATHQHLLAFFDQYVNVLGKFLLQTNLGSHISFQNKTARDLSVKPARPEEVPFKFFSRKLLFNSFGKPSNR